MAFFLSFKQLRDSPITQKEGAGARPLGWRSKCFYRQITEHGGPNGLYIPVFSTHSMRMLPFDGFLPPFFDTE